MPDKIGSIKSKTQSFFEGEFHFLRFLKYAATGKSYCARSIWRE